MTHNRCLHCGAQIVEGDLIGALAGAMAALLRAPQNGDAWMTIALRTLDLFASVLIVLESAPAVPVRDAPVIVARWKRCGEVRLPQNMAKVRTIVCMYSCAGTESWGPVTRVMDQLLSGTSRHQATR